jgi:hypothetical protein
VLVLVVQNTVQFDDLGVATSAVTFFRTIGSSFGAAIFGSLYTAFLNDRIGLALAASGASPSAAESPQTLHALPPEVAAPIIDAYADSLGRVFLCAAPVALVGFLIALFLKQVPVQQRDAVSAASLGEGFAMPSGDSSEQILEITVARMVRNVPELRLRHLAGQSGGEVDVAQLWALLEIYRQSRVFGSARLTAVADGLRIPAEVLESTFDETVRNGYALRTGDQLWLTRQGVRQVDAVSKIIVALLVQKLSQSPNFEAAPNHTQVEAALERIARRILGQRDFDDHIAELAESPPPEIPANAVSAK